MKAKNLAQEFIEQKFVQKDALANYYLLSFRWVLGVLLTFGQSQAVSPCFHSL